MSETLGAAPAFARPKAFVVSRTTDARPFTPAPVQASDAAPLAFAVITERAELAELACEWNALQERCGAGIRVFQSHAWVLAWSRHFVDAAGTPSRCRLAIVTVRQGARLVAVWPLATSVRFGIRQLLWAGAPVSQYGDVLIEPGPDADEVITRSWGFLVAALAPDIVHLRKVRGDAAVMPLFGGQGATACCRQQAASMNFGAQPDYAVYEQRYSGKVRKNRRRLLRRLEEKGRVAFVHHRPGPTASALALRAIEMKQTWLQQRGMLSPALSDARTAAFFREVAARAAGAGDLLVSALTLDDRPCALMVALTAGDRVAGHVFTYDLDFEKSGVGVLLLEECLRHACAEGFRSYDLLAPADAYKLDWADTMTDVSDWTIACTPRGRIYDRVVLRWLRQGARTLLSRLNLGWLTAARARLVPDDAAADTVGAPQSKPA